MSALDPKAWDAARAAANAEQGDYYTFNAKLKAGITAYLAASPKGQVEADQAWRDWWADKEPWRYATKEVLAAEAFQAGWSAASPIADLSPAPSGGWQDVSSLFDEMSNGEQLDVLFAGPKWGWPILGVVTRFDGTLDWMEYDQQNDKYLAWDAEPPTIFTRVPELPAAPSQVEG